MIRPLICLALGWPLLGQMPSSNPMTEAVEGYRQAHRAGRFAEAAAKRDEARDLLARVPVESPQFSGQVLGIAYLYQEGGRMVQAREVVQNALERAAALGESHPIRIQMLQNMATFWQQDRSLLRALSYMEKAAAASENAPPSTAAAAGVPVAANRAVMLNGVVSFDRLEQFGRFGRAPMSPAMSLQRLADLYLQLGRKEDATATIAKMQTRFKDDAMAAQLLDRMGKQEEAAAVYRRKAEGAADPVERAGALQSLASLYQTQQRRPEAIATLQQVVALYESTGKPEMRDQAVWPRLMIADLLSNDGNTEAAEKIYLEMLGSVDRSLKAQVINSYTNHLMRTKQFAKGEEYVNQYLASRTDFQPWEEAGLWNSAARLARSAGATDRASKYEQAAQESQRRNQPPNQAQEDTAPRIQTDLSRAVTAARQGRSEEALALAEQAVAAARGAPDRDTLTGLVSPVARELARQKQYALADALFQRLIGEAESWKADTVEPLVSALQAYASHQIEQKNFGEAVSAIDRYRSVLTGARGPESGELTEPLRIAIRLERSREAYRRAAMLAEELLGFESTLSGTSSDAYGRTLEEAAQVYETANDRGRALALRRQAITVVDRSASERDVRRGSVRMSAASALARAGEFDEAERLASEAVAIGEAMRPPRAEMFQAQVNQIRQMRQAQEKAAQKK